MKIKIQSTHNPPSPPFRKGGIIIPLFDKGGLRRERSADRLGGILSSYLLRNSKGISVLFLVIAMLLMVVIGYVLSYLIPTKQKSVLFSIHSNQAFFIAQSGVEFAVRYATDQGWTTPAALNGLDNMQRNLGQGTFTLDYDDVNNRLTSRGQIPNSSERRIVVSNFTSFLQRQLILSTPPVPCLRTGIKVEFYIQNIGSTTVTLNSFSSSWTQNPPARRINLISLGGTPKFAGPPNYGSGDGPRNFNVGIPPTYTINAGQTILVEAWFNNIINNLANMIVTFYSTTGESYDFNLDPEGDGLPVCP